MTILVTGASGFLGVNLIRHLATTHPLSAIVAADCHGPSHQDQAAIEAAAGRVTFETLDVCDALACREVLERTRPTHVLHAAAVTLSDKTTAAIDRTWAVNLHGTIHLLEAVIAMKSVQRCVVLSSSGVYSQPEDEVPCNEDHSLDLSSTYASSKREVELRLPALEAAAGFPIVAARVGPAYGPLERQRPSRPRVSLVQQLLGCLIERRPAVIAGSDVFRDWTHAADIAAALDGLLFSPLLRHRIYNVSSGLPVSARDLISLFAERGLQVRWTSSVEEAAIVLDPQDSRKPLVTARLQQDTGFHPGFTMRAGLADLIAHNLSDSPTNPRPAMQN